MFDASAAGAPPIVQVALPVPVDSLFDYDVPPRLAAEAEPGRRVLVPFGSRRMVGVVVARLERSTRTGTGRKAIERVVDAAPVLSRDLLRVLLESAEEVLCPPGIALAAALPAGSAPRPREGYRLTPRGREALRSGALRGEAGALAQSLARGSAGAAALRRRHPRAASLLVALERDRLVERAASEQAPSARVGSVRLYRIADGVDVEAATRGPLARAPQQAALLRQLAAHGPLEAPALAAQHPGALPLLRALGRRGLVASEECARPRDVLGAALEPPQAFTPTWEQAAALEVVAAAVRARRFERFLLHGITGSGKTEVYLGAVEEALRAGRQALVLVPEIPLTHQILARLRGRFGDALAVLHSGLRPGERLEQWLRLRRGDTPIALGARSALFAPLENLGLIVIDEEHDSAYKSEDGFRYHARDLAARRAAQSGCPLLFGSATPSLETRFEAEAGGLRRLVLSHRIGGRPLPAVEIVDLAAERASTPRGRKLVLSRALRQAMAQTLAAGGQTILLLNRRGFSTRIFCFQCGHAERCDHCDISLVYHASEQRLRCHYCDYRIAPSDSCSSCGAPESALLGLGTERLEEEVRRQFPAARIARLDRDTAARRGESERVLTALREGSVDIVVGTQMVAKGHDFPGVRLVGVVAADLGLQLPDFRAAERCFQLLTQVAGRAGRGAEPGRVIVQTFAPDHYAIRPVREHDYESFYSEEIRHRAALGYPPLGRLASVLVSGPEASVTQAAAQTLARGAREELGGLGAGMPPQQGEPARLEVLGPAPAPLARLRDRYRFQLLVKGADEKAVLRIARLLARAAARLPSPVRAVVDVNPVNML